MQHVQDRELAYRTSKYPRATAIAIALSAVLFSFRSAS